MLIQTPSTVKHKPLKEAVAESKQRNKDAIRHTLLPNQDALMDAAERIGKPILHTDLIQRIKKLTDSNIWAEESIRIKYIFGKSMWSFYSRKGEISATVVDAGWIPEYTIVSKVNEYGQPTEKMRGWREVLLRLMQTKHLTHKQVLKHFGTPTPTNLDNWPRQIQRFN